MGRAWDLDRAPSSLRYYSSCAFLSAFPLIPENEAYFSNNQGFSEAVVTEQTGLQVQCDCVSVLKDKERW